MKTKLLLLLTIAFIKSYSQTTNYALNFNGVNNYVDLGTSVGSSIRSIEFWFNPNVTINSTTITSPGHSFIIRNDANENKEYGFYIRGYNWFSGYGNLRFFMRDNGILHEIASNSDTWVAGTWYHVCGTIDTINGMKLYINGVLQNNTDASCTTAIPASGEITTIGTWGDAYIRYFKGSIDEVRFWNRALLQTEIQSKMCSWLLPSIEVGLTSYWKMDEGSGPIITDATLTGNNGNIVGAMFIEDRHCFYTVEVKEHNSNYNISAYPNPMVNEMTLKLNEKLLGASLSMLNSIGQKVLELPITDQTMTILRNELKSGVYLIQIKNNNILLVNKKIVISD